MQADSLPTALLAVEASALTRTFGRVVALDRVSLGVRKGEFFAVLGPSGCGKTTLLRLIAGLDLPDAGTLRLAGAEVAGVPAHRRQVNAVFQSYALFPHLTARDNIAFGLRVRRVPAAQIQERVARVMATTQIADLAGRRPAELSGGQQQRVALARALVSEPAVLLLDEPLGALDLTLRKQLQSELHALQRRLGLTLIYVTHDQHEALALSDRIAVMNAGRIEQIAAPAELYERPRTRFVAQFVGACNLLSATVAETVEEGFQAATPLGPLFVAWPEGAAPRAPGTRCTLAIRPEKLAVSRSDSGVGVNTLAATVTAVVYSGAETTSRLACGGQALSATTLNVRAGPPDWQVGETVFCHLPPAALTVLED